MRPDVFFIACFPDTGLRPHLRSPFPFSIRPSLPEQPMTAGLPTTTANAEMTALLTALNALRQGRSGVRLPPDWAGVAGKVADAFNDVVEQNERMVEELA